MIKNLFAKVDSKLKLSDKLNRLKLFIAADPRRAKFISILAITLIVPLTVAGALTIQNWKQHAGGGGLITISDSIDHHTLTETSNPNVFIGINIFAAPDWVIQSSPSASNNSLIKNAYAQESVVKPAPGDKTSPCFPYGDVDGDGYITKADANLIADYTVGNTTLTEDQKKIADITNDGKININDSMFISQYIKGSRTTFPTCDNKTAAIPLGGGPQPTSTPTATLTPTPSLTCIQKGDANGDGKIDALDITKVERIIAGADPATEGADANGDGKVNAVDITKIERYIAGLDIPPACPISSPTPTITSTPSATITPAPKILRAIYVENKDTDGSTGGSEPLRIAVNSVADIANIPWKLNDLLPGQTQAPRFIQITFIGDADTAPYSTSVNLTAPDPNILSRVDISLFDCTTQVQVGQECHMSALANPNNPTPKNIIYTWGISSTNSIGTLNETNGNITGFLAQNVGTGDVWVLAQQGNIQVQKSITIQAVAAATKSAGTVNTAIKPALPPVLTETKPNVSQTSITAPINADLNGDNSVNCKDMKILVGQFGQKGSNLTADLNHDGAVDGIDLNALLKNYTPGDTTKCL